MEKMITEIKELLKESPKITLSYDDLEKRGWTEQINRADTRTALIKEKIIQSWDKGKKEITLSTLDGLAIKEEKTPKIGKLEKRETEFKPHTYILPPFHKDMKQAISDASGMLVYGVGPTGSGKTHHLRILAEELDMQLYLINCKADMDTASFLGDRTISIDKTTGQNHIVWQDGPVIKAMQEGLDEEGNEIGKPALLVIDEAPVMPSHIAIGFNNLLENWSTKRRVVLDGDGGRVVTSHSKFRIVMLGNTIGKGITDLSEANYTAQGDALDISTLDRIHMIFQYGYNKQAEEKLLVEKMGDNTDVKNVIKIRDLIRKEYKAGKTQTPFSTRILVQIADAYRTFEGNLGKALYYTVYNKVLPLEKQVYNETIMAVLAVDVENKFGLGRMFD